MNCEISWEASNALYCLSEEYERKGIGFVNPCFEFQLERFMSLLHASGTIMSAGQFSLLLQEWNLPESLSDQAALRWQRSSCFIREG